MHCLPEIQQILLLTCFVPNTVSGDEQHVACPQTPASLRVQKETVREQSPGQPSKRTAGMWEVN